MRFTPLDSMETPYLRLRPLTFADAPSLFDQMLGDADTMRDLPVPRHTGVSQTAEFIDEALRGWSDGSLIRYALECKDSGRLTALIELKPTLPRVEIGVIISRHGGARRRRAGILALQELIDRLIEQPGVYRIFACCAVDGAAHSSMERLGFVKEALLTNHEPRPNRGLAAADSYLYALTRPAPVPPEPASAGVAWLRNTMQWSLADA
ncbi:RimJ/RimL family protein N-acetyltransferase [Paraburkholderia sp. BL23I1N1]|uniref:GNAT family N-acetyltransferase n=1 Tax=Paraburkholderia sp. BL23I1N1 TaxID=1938802 RepID=UPI000E7573DA|nr:GNAT family protein [Paraburkholderia sp. BL23I1N1]RKE40069.1 RimJ/RimL family protein N-acetyltransferase [Paraburkholderia sp. BL23I1N1]